MLRQMPVFWCSVRNALSKMGPASRWSKSNSIIIRLVTGFASLANRWCKRSLIRIRPATGSASWLCRFRPVTGLASKWSKGHIINLRLVTGHAGLAGWWSTRSPVNSRLASGLASWWSMSNLVNSRFVTDIASKRSTSSIFKIWPDAILSARGFFKPGP